MKLGPASDPALQQSGELFRRHARLAEDRAERALRQVAVAVDGDDDQLRNTRLDEEW